jgi:arylsulfatase A-like enzyme
MKHHHQQDCRYLSAKVGSRLTTSARAIVAIACVVTPLSIAEAAPPRARAKHTVVLLVDDFGWADFAFRSAELPTPHLDRLRADGVSFTNAYAASPTCSPSRASVLTGRHPARYKLVRHVSGPGEWHQWPDDPVQMPSRNWLPLEETTYAEALVAAGHRCVFVGKWHLGPERFFPQHQGFGETFGVTAEGHPRDYYPPYFPQRVATYSDVPPGKYLTDQVTDDAIAAIESHDPSESLQLTLFWYGVHEPLIGKKEHLETLKSSGLEGRELQFAAMTLSIDESIGRVREALDAAGIADETLLVFAGDQGGPLDNTPLRGGKHDGATYEGGARIPAVIVWPGVAEPGAERDAPVTTLDIAPTLLDACGVDPLGPLDGTSLLPLLADDSELTWDEREVVIYRSYYDLHAAIRVGDWKLVVSRNGKHQLYNLADDIGEANDLYEARPKVSRELLGRFRRWEREVGVDDVSMASTSEHRSMP